MITDDEYFSKTPSNKIFIKYFFTIFFTILFLQSIGFLIYYTENLESQVNNTEF